MTRDIVAALYAEEMAMDDFMSDQSAENRQGWLDKKAIVDALMAPKAVPVRDRKTLLSSTLPKRPAAA